MQEIARMCQAGFVNAQPARDDLDARQEARVVDLTRNDDQPISRRNAAICCVSGRRKVLAGIWVFG